MAFLTAAVNGYVWSTSRPGRFNPGKENWYPLYLEGGWAPGPVWSSTVNLALAAQVMGFRMT